eukprot:TRINITY_DN824_c0_g1_i1.p2 TRINITY_DN824_c0_g1~~TRINITY_DN824_c0_g1_i1.p2  ORF type:complete len:400 (-),score=77.52 TRINITY_DN824_c0_g1_i1:68-1267(-)
MSVTLNASQTVSDKSKIRSSELSPLKLCLKFTPPSLALYYTLASSPNKKFLHTASIDKEIKAEMSATEIYEKLLGREPGYWNPKAVSKKQVIKLIEKLLEKKLGNSNGPLQKSEKTEETPKESTVSISDRMSYMKQLSIESSAYTNPVLVTNVEDVGSINAESVVINPPVPMEKYDRKVEMDPPENPVPTNPQNRKAIPEKIADPDLFYGDKEPQKPTEIKSELARRAIEEYKYKENSEEEEDYDALNKGNIDPDEEDDEEFAKIMERQDMQQIYEEMLMRILLNQQKKIGKGEKLPEADMDPGEEEGLSPEELAYLKGFQRVFVEDLGEELLMDPAGNLYDMDGNLIGQAASDNEDGDNEDQKYFEEDPQPVPTRKQPAVPPSSKQRRSHSPQVIIIL